MSSEEYIEGFIEDVGAQGRVVLMASREDQLSYSGGFAPYVIDGLRKYADSNNDKIVTAEEVFYYTEPRTYRQNPTMYDGYEGELPIFYLPDSPKNSENEEISDFKLKIGSSTENSIFCGFIKDAENDNPIENAIVRALFIPFFSPLFW